MYVYSCVSVCYVVMSMYVNTCTSMYICVCQCVIHVVMYMYVHVHMCVYVLNAVMLTSFNELLIRTGDVLVPLLSNSCKCVFVY